MNMETGGFGGDDRRRWLVPALIVAAVAIVLILILLIGRLISSRTGSSATATPPRTATRAAIIASPSASRAVLPPLGGASAAPNASQAPAIPTPTAQAKKFVTVSSSGDVLNMRATPSTGGEILKKLTDGTRLEDLGQTQDADGIKWRKVKDPTDNTEGWVSSEFVIPANP